MATNNSVVERREALGKNRYREYKIKSYISLLALGTNKLK